LYDHIYLEIAMELKACQFVFFRDDDYGWRFDEMISRIRENFRVAGWDPDRFITQAKWMRKPSFFGLMSFADVYLDPPGFSGFTTAISAVEMGLPLVTLEGKWMRQRLAAGLLKKIGAEELIVHDSSDYVNLAVSLARQPEERIRLKDILKSAFKEHFVKRDGKDVLGTVLQKLATSQ
jgi:predicted O-linked N-acetylglucosamine transferase (SPINDLY family)